MEIELDVPQCEVEVEAPELELSQGGDIELEIGDPVTVEIEIESPNIFGKNANTSGDGTIDIDLQPNSSVTAKPKAKQAVKVKSKEFQQGLIGSENTEITVVFLRKVYLWLLMQVFIVWLSVLAILCIPHTWFMPVYTLSWLFYLWLGFVGLILLGLAFTGCSCSINGVMGILIWVLLLIGGLGVYDIRAMRNKNDEGFDCLYFLSILLAMFCGLRSYVCSRPDPSYDTCTVFPYIIIPQVFVAFIISFIDSGNSTRCIGDILIVTIFGICCKISGELIIEGKKKHYRRGQSCAAAMKMYTDIFVVMGELIYAGYQKGEITNEIIVTFN